MNVSYLERDVWEPAALVEMRDAPSVLAPLKEAIINRYAAQYVDTSKLVAEIGSGLGSLGSLLGAAEINTHVEGSLDIAKEHQAILQQKDEPDASIVNADLYNLPFRRESVGSVLGLLVIDAVYDMRGVINECARVLRPNGTFVYFHDAGASMNASARLIQQNGEVPVPLSDRRLAHFESRDVKRFIKLATRQWKHKEINPGGLILDLLSEDVQFDYWRLQEPEIVQAVTEVVEGDRKLKKTIIGHATEAFVRCLHQASEEAGLKIEEKVLVQEEALITKEEAQQHIKDFGEHNNAIYSSVLGHSGTAYIPEIPSGKVAVGLEMLCFVARKPDAKLLPI